MKINVDIPLKLLYNSYIKKHYNEKQTCISGRYGSRHRTVNSASTKISGFESQGIHQFYIITVRYEMTSIEKAIIAITAFLLVGLGTFLYVIAHFIAKVW